MSGGKGTLALRVQKLAIIALLGMLGACGGGGGDSSPDQDGGGGDGGGGDGGGGGSENGAPMISGQPPGNVLASQSYSFVPTASDPDDDVLTFSIEGQPAWASFDTASGALTGTPAEGDVGMYAGIVIQVSDGQADSALPSFSIEVLAAGNGMATLSWTPPTENEDGSQLVDLAGYKVHYGTTSGQYPNQIDVPNPGLSSYVVENLVPGTYHFVVTAYNESGLQSGFSNEASKTVNP